MSLFTIIDLIYTTALISVGIPNFKDDISDELIEYKDPENYILFFINILIS